MDVFYAVASLDQDDIKRLAPRNDADLLGKLSDLAAGAECRQAHEMISESRRVERRLDEGSFLTILRERRMRLQNRSGLLWKRLALNRQHVLPVGEG